MALGVPSVLKHYEDLYSDFTDAMTMANKAFHKESVMSEQSRQAANVLTRAEAASSHLYPQAGGGREHTAVLARVLKLQSLLPMTHFLQLGHTP